MYIVRGVYGSSGIVIIFASVRWEGGVMGCRMLQNQHLKSTLLVGREAVIKKVYSVYAMDNVDNSGRPLMLWIWKRSYLPLKILLS